MTTDCTEIATKFADELMAYYDGRAFIPLDAIAEVDGIVEEVANV